MSLLFYRCFNEIKACLEELFEACISLSPSIFGVIIELQGCKAELPVMHKIDRNLQGTQINFVLMV
jgi:hypothetical protein